jgi:hypothetical protein
VTQNLLYKCNGHVFDKMADAMKEVFEVRKGMSLNTIIIFTYITRKDRYLDDEQCTFVGSEQAC